MAGKRFKLVATELSNHCFEYAVGSQKFVLGVNPENDGIPALRICPVDLLLGALAGCVGLTIRAEMDKRGYVINDLKVEISGHRTDGGEHRGLTGISTQVLIDSPKPLEVLRPVVELAEKSCTVRTTVEHLPHFETVIEKVGS